MFGSSRVDLNTEGSEGFLPLYTTIHRLVKSGLQPESSVYLFAQS
jgi:hypothetical protein